MSNEILIMTDLNKMFEYVKNNNNGKKFTISNGKLLFNENKDLIEFERLTKDIAVYAKIEEELLNKLKKIQNDNYYKLTEETKK